MKNQYVGDRKDYLKYGLIRTIACSGNLRIGVFWMLTDDDASKDGRDLDYLRAPDRWRHFDPDLFDTLAGIVHIERRRDVLLVRQRNVIPCAFFVEHRIPDDRDGRREAFLDAMAFLASCEMVFFDPDNGLEVKSTPYGRKGSSKFLYLHEVKRAFESGHSLLIYQHFPRYLRRAEEPEYVAERAAKLKEFTTNEVVTSFATESVCFFMVPQPRHAEYFADRIDNVRRTWNGQFRIVRH